MQTLEDKQAKRGEHDTDELHVPYLVAARILIEWARIDNRAGIRGWGSEYWGMTVTIGNDVWSIGHRNNRGDPVIAVTVEGHKHGGGEKYTRNWEIHPDDLLQGVRVPVRRAW